MTFGKCFLLYKMEVYYAHQYVSNSELKQISDLDTGREKPTNLDEIFARGRLNHYALTEPHKAQDMVESMLRDADEVEERKRIQDDYQKAKEMAQTVYEDELCQRILLMPDFRAEHEWYRLRNPWDVEGIRCKTDGDSRIASVTLEYKGLAVNSMKAFISSFSNFCYDQAAAFYYEGTLLNHYLIVAVSKINTRKLFKLMVDRGDKYHVVGDAKVRKAIRLWKSYGLQ